MKCCKTHYRRYFSIPFCRFFNNSVFTFYVLALDMDFMEKTCKLIRHHSDPSLNKGQESPLHQRRNGKHDIFVGVGGDDVLSLFKKHDDVGRSRSFCCNLLAEDTRPISRGPSMESFASSPKSRPQSPLSISGGGSVLSVDREQPSREGSTSPRLQQRRNGLCYVNSKDMIVKTIKQKKTAAELQKRNNNVLLQVSWL